MRKSKISLNNKIKENKIIVLIVILLILLVGYVTIPTLANYKNRAPINSITAWDGSIANSYRSGDGTSENPYVISNGSEFAYFATQISASPTKYENEYFILNNDIVLNDGIFSYSKGTGIKYIKGNEENIITPNLDSNIINVFQHLNGFKGNLDGNYHYIYGLYIDDPVDEQNALFTNLEGNISNLYVQNSIIYGGKITAGIASIANNATLKNVLYNGYVISDEEVAIDTITLELEDITETTINNTINTNINLNNLKYINGNITSITLKGTNQSDGILKINNELVNVGDFELNLGTKLQNSIPLVYESTSESNINLTNLKYQVTYNYSNAAGIVSIAENTTLENIINKADVFASINASGIVNTISNTNLKNTYNTGNINSDYASSALVSNINQNIENITITDSYNNGELTSDNSAMIGNIENNSSNITIENVFNTKDNYAINKVESTNVNIINSYIVNDKQIKTGTSDGQFTQTTLENLENKSFIQEKLKYEEFDSSENIENKVWVFENNSLSSLPILYMDDLNNPIANIYVDTYNWNSYNDNLNTIKIPSSFTFSIEEIDVLNPIKEIYYYISNEKNPLTKEEVISITNWTSYNNIVNITQEGFYTIYAKIVDYNNNITYLNTDLLVLDLTGASITISTSFKDDTWSSLKTDLTNYYIDREINIDIKAEDSLSGISKIYYHISNTILTEEEVEKLEEWNEYTESIAITDSQSIVYVKAIDNCNYATYANSDLIILNGYSLNNITPGMTEVSEDNIYITEKSSISLNFTYKDTNNYLEDHKHQLISNTLLPQNTKITLIDKINSKVYRYITSNSDYGYNNCIDNNCEAVYDFSLFKEIGSNVEFQESNYTGEINEEFVVVIDFANTEITENIEDITISLKMNNNNTNEIRNTLVSTLKTFNIDAEDSHAKFTLSTTFEDTINYNENSKYIIDLSAKLNYKFIETKKIFDTTYDDKNIGLSIKMVDSTGNIVENKYLKNISFSIGEKKYSPSRDGIVRINLEKGLNDITDNLIIQTYADNSKLASGNYKFVIGLYTAYDGIYSNNNLKTIEIPVHVGVNNYNTDNSFNVIMNEEDKIITTNENEFNFKFLLNDIYDNANIKISLYKKKELKANDQTYTQIDLSEYLIDTTLEKYDTNIYYASKNVTNNDIFSLNLNTSLLEKNGYMFVIELYDNERLVNKINKKFIIK